MTRSRLVSVLAAVVSFGLVQAAPARAERALTIDETLTLAKQNNLDLKAARARLAVAKVGIEQARVALLPQVNAQGKYTHNYKNIEVQFPVFNTAVTPPEFLTMVKATITPQEQLDGNVNALVPVIAPSAYPALSAAKKSYQASQSNFQVTETEILFVAAQQFFAAAGTDQLVTARHNAVLVAQQTANDVKTRYEAGTVNKVDMMRAQIAVVRAEQAERDAIDRRADAYARLATVLVLREPFQVNAPGDTELVAQQLDDPSVLVSQALTRRPEFAAFQANLASLSANIDAQKWKWAPTLSGFANARAFNYGGFSGDHFAWAVGAQLDWQIYDGGARDAQRHSYEAQRLDTDYRYLQLKNQISDDVLIARRQVELKRTALDSARSEVTLAQETLKLTRSQYEAGTVLQIDLLAAQDSLVEADLALANARFDLALADLTLRRSTGAFPFGRSELPAQ